jgi:hypothetical protein
MRMRIAYVTIYTWDWQPIGQATVDLSHLERDDEIDRSELDDAAQKAARSLIDGKDIRDLHVFIHEGDPTTPEELLETAKQEHTRQGPDSVSWGRNRRLRRPGPISPRPLKRRD